MFASALDRPGWSRSCKAEDVDLEALADDAGRYRAVAGIARADVRPLALAVAVVEHPPGGSAIDGGAPEQAGACDDEPMTDAECQRWIALVPAGWSHGDEVAATVSAERRKGAGRNACASPRRDERYGGIPLPPATSDSGIVPCNRGDGSPEDVISRLPSGARTSVLGYAAAIAGPGSQPQRCARVRLPNALLTILCCTQYRVDMETEEALVQSQYQEIRRGSVVIAVLSLLRAPGYGYALLERLNGAGIEVEANTLYPLLRRLEKQGLLVAEWTTDEARPRKYYRTSDAGLRALGMLVDEWRRVTDRLLALVGEGEPR